MKALNIHSYID